MGDTTNIFIVSQIFAGITILLDIITFQLKKREHLLWCMVFATISMGIHFVLLENYTAAWMMGIATVRLIASVYWQKNWLAMFFVVISIGLTAWSYNGLLSLLSGSGNILQTISTFRKNQKQLRMLMFCGSFIWLVHNILEGTPGGIIAELILLGSIVVGYYRYYIKRPGLTQ